MSRFTFFRIQFGGGVKDAADLACVHVRDAGQSKPLRNPVGSGDNMQPEGADISKPYSPVIKSKFDLLRYLRNDTSADWQVITTADLVRGVS